MGFSLGTKMTLIGSLAKHLGKTEAEVKHFLRFAPNKYKVYQIPKRSHGHRVIAQPSKELKTYQRAILEIYQFPVHQAATAYRKNTSIKDNASVHKSSPYLLKTDFENFFNSITPKLFWNAFDTCKSLNFTFDEEDRYWIERLLFWCPSRKQNGKLILSIGAPTSPHISNFCLFEFDRFLTDYCHQRKIRYSRYADDLTFSTKVKYELINFTPELQKILRQFFDQNMQINHRKTVLSSKAHNRHVTGVTINNAGELSLGRERKRYIKHLVHQFNLGQLNISDTGYLRGLLSFAHHIEPIFIERLKLKYTEQVIQKILRME